MTHTRTTFPEDARSAVGVYLTKGLAPIPLPLRSKNPGRDGWQHLRLTPDALDEHFPVGKAQNVGILNGAPSGNTADVDLDCPEARRIAGDFLPATGWTFGRKSAPRSHYIYRTDCPLDTAANKYEDTDGEVLLELRGTGGQSVWPPSTHKETGERITWERFEEKPAEVALDDLHRAARELAAAAILARHWPHKGRRDDAALALTGGLCRAGWDEERVGMFVGAVATAAGDEQARARASKAPRAAERLKEDGKVKGWPVLATLLLGNGDEVVRRVREWLKITNTATISDLPIPQAPPWPDPPGEEAFYGLAGQIVRTIEPASEADTAALLMQTLVAFGNVIGRSAHFEVEADRHHGNEFVVLMGKTSKARKGTSWGRIDRLYREVEEQWAAERVQSGLSSGEGLIWAVRDPIEKQERVKEKGEVRYETVQADPGIEDKRLLIYEPEFANVLKQTERQGNTVSVILRHAWDGRTLRSLTKNSPAAATGAHVSLVGHITAEELRRYLTQTETANGFANRFLWVCTDRSKLLPKGGHVDPGAWAALRTELVDALGFAKSAGEVRRDEEATELWCEEYGRLSEGKPGLAGALLARAEAHVMRLAQLYALLDRSSVIQLPHLMAARVLWDYCERSVYFVFGDQLGDPVADDLLRLLRSIPGGLTRNDIMNYLGRNQSSDRVGRALGLLRQHHLARVDKPKPGTKGRPAERWFAAAGGRGDLSRNYPNGRGGENP
jgi:hypothetical protein